MGVALDAVMTGGNDGGDVESADNGTSISTATAITLGGLATLLIVCANWRINATGPVTSRSFTWDGVAMTEAAFVNVNVAGDDRNSVAIYVLANPATGAKTLAGTWVGAADCYVGAISFVGTDTATGIKAADTATTSGVTSINVTGSADGATVATFLTDGAEPTTSQTKFWGAQNLDPGGAGSYEVGTSGTVTHTFTGAGGTAHQLAAVHVIAGLAAGFLPLMGQILT